jgi:hypothetical protein
MLETIPRAMYGGERGIRNFTGQIWRHTMPSNAFKIREVKIWGGH